MNRPRVFVASSKEAINVAHAIQQNLQQGHEVTVWDQAKFRLTHSVLSSLLELRCNADFGAFVLAPDDLTTIRGQTKRSVRDNVLLELGLFLGNLGPDRCFILTPLDSADLLIPSDLGGLTFAIYDAEHTNIVAGVGAACSQLRNAISEIMRKAPAPMLQAEPMPIAHPILCRSSRIVKKPGTLEGYALERRDLVSKNPRLRVAVFGPHVDDIELGCGGTLARLIDEYGAILFYYVFSGSSLSWDGKRTIEGEGRIIDAKRSFMTLVKGSSQLSVQEEKEKIIQLDGEDGGLLGKFNYFNFRDTEMESQVEKVRQQFRELQTTDLAEVDLIFVPSFKDVHQDHRVMGTVALQVFRKQETVLFYCTPDSGKHPHERFNPNLYFDISNSVRSNGVYGKIRKSADTPHEGDYATYMDVKLKLLDIFHTEINKPWYKTQAFLARAIDCAEEAYLPTVSRKLAYAEGFEGVLRI